MIDLYASLFVLSLLLGTLTSYTAHLRRGHAIHFARVDAAGPSPLLGRRAMEMVYWGLQPLARVCLRAGLRANTITGMSLGLGAVAGAALAQGHLGVGGALAAASSLGDVLDGLVARETGTGTRGGALFDAAADRYQEFFFIGGLALHYHEREAVLGVALLALAGSFMVSYSTAKAEAVGVRPPPGGMRRAERAACLCAGALLSPLAQPIASRVHTLSTLVEAPMLAALVLVGLASNISAALRFRAVARTPDAPAVRDAAPIPPRTTPGAPAPSARAKPSRPAQRHARY